MGGRSRPLRPDELRKAFNAPFWPYVLATTSIGQEGLDFHCWCDTIIHWDLADDPVSHEQRQGRIQRLLLTRFEGKLRNKPQLNSTDTVAAHGTLFHKRLIVNMQTVPGCVLGGSCQMHRSRIFS